MTARDFINQVFLIEFRQLIAERFHYLAFSLIGLGIEFLGACLDDAPFDERQRSGQRFVAAVRLFPGGYAAHGGALYEDLRCGFAHQLRPGLRFVLTNREEAATEHTEHFGPFRGKTVLVCEDLYADFEKVCRMVVAMIDSGQLNDPKLAEQFLSVT